MLKKIKKYLKIEEEVKRVSLTLKYEQDILNRKDENFLDLKSDLIVSLTTYNKRIYKVHLVIESIFKQTIKPKKIYLWLAEDEFNYDTIPKILKKMEKNGLIIKFCKDLKSYKKLIPTLKIEPNNPILTIDDDIFYSYDFIERIYREYIKNPKNIYFYRGHKMEMRNDRKFKRYNSFKHDFKGLEESIYLLPTGVGGVLYPPNSLDLEVLNEQIFMKIAPTCDDIWFKSMSVKKGTKCKKIEIEEEFAKKNIDILVEQEVALSYINLGKGKNQNDIQLKAIFDYYNLWEKLKNEE